MSEEVLTCRFCHDEGTETEPLFYPCKCTGSIKYIHKECLDEWLKHSKQKVCGVCKEAYAYKTVYAENMPRYMPVADTVKLFYRQVSPSVKKTANIVFVCTMWLIVFPYTVHLNLSQFAIVCRYMFGVNKQPDNVAVGRNGLLGLIVNVVIQALNSYLPTLFGLLVVPFANYIYNIVDKRYEETINKEAARIKAKQERDEEVFNQAVQELMPLGNLADNNEEGPRRIDDIMQELDDAIARLQEMRERIDMDFRHFGLIPGRWVRIVGLVGISKKVVKFYLTQLMIVHLALMLLYWVPFTAGLAIASTNLSSLANLFDICATVFNSIVPNEYKYLHNVALGLMGLALAGYFKSSFDVSVMMQLLFIAPFCIKNAEAYELLVLLLNRIMNPAWIFNIGSNNPLYTVALSALEENNSYSLQITTAVGYFALLFMFWCLSSIAKRYANPGYAKAVWVCRGFVNYTLVGFSILVVTVTVIGLMFILPFMMTIEQNSLGIVFSYIKSNFWTAASVLWVSGQIEAVTFFFIARVWKKHTRPGFMWYINTDENKSSISNSIFQYNIGGYFWSIIKLALLVLTVATLVTAVPLLILESASVFSLSDITIPKSMFELAAVCAFDAMIWSSTFISVWSAGVFSYVSSKTSQLLGITEYVTGQQNILDEGRWSFKEMKWFYIPFANYLMPNHIVEDAFKQVNARYSDRARIGKKRKSLPTKKYYARIQQAIDSSLSDTCLAFTLKPNNVRVPRASFANIPKTRKHTIPLNDDGMPIDPMHDYETADHPERREWAESQGMTIPPPLADDYDEKYAFRKSDYITVYQPPMLNLRETFYFGSVFAAFSTVVFAALSFICSVGYFALKCLRIESTNTSFLLCAGYLVILFARAFVASGFRLWHENSLANLVLVRQVVQPALEQVCKLGCIVIAFGVVLPTLFGMVKEMYISVPYYHYFLTGYPQHTSDTSLLQFVYQIWRSNVILAISGSLTMCFITNNEWLEDVFLGIFEENRLWRVWRLIKRRAIPAAVKLAAIYLLPIVLSTVNLVLSNSLTSVAFRRLILLQDTDVLAPLVRISVLSCAAVLFATNVVVTYRSCMQMVRDKLYAVNQVLENVDGSSTPHYGPSGPETPSSA